MGLIIKKWKMFNTTNEGIHDKHRYIRYTIFPVYIAIPTGDSKIAKNKINLKASRMCMIIYFIFQYIGREITHEKLEL
jgi:hypothetical protein